MFAPFEKSKKSQQGVNRVSLRLNYVKNSANKGPLHENKPREIQVGAR